MKSYPRTDGDHALAIIVEVLHQHFTEAMNLAFATFREVARQEPILLLQRVHKVRQFLDNALVCAKVILFGQHQTEVEDKLIAVVASRFHTDWVTQNTIAICTDLEQVATEFLTGYHEEGDIREGQEEGLRGSSRGGNNGAVGNLMNNFRS